MKQIEYDEFHFDGKSKQFEILRSTFIVSALSAPTYVRLNGSARDGTIGRVEFDEGKGLVNETKYNALRKGAIDIHSSLDAHSMAQRSAAIRESKSYELYISARNYNWYQFNLRMDDGKLITPKVFNGDDVMFTWLTDYKGPTVNEFNKQSRAQREASRVVKPFFDCLGHKLEVGMFVAVYCGFNMRAGMVTKFSVNGETAYIAIGDPKPFRAMYPEKIMVIDDGTKTRAMMKKLANGE